MRSNALPGDLAARIGSAIDQLAEAADAAAGAADRELAVRLAQAWALIAEADPELAERAERYSRLAITGRPWSGTAH